MRAACAPFPLTARIGLLRFIFRCLLNSAFFQRYATLIGPPLRSISRLTCQLASLGMSPAYRLPVSNFTTITVAKLAVFVRLFPVFPFSFHTLQLCVVARATIRAHDEWLFRRASSSIVNVFLLLHPSMPTALPSINISFHLSDSSLSLGAALSSPPASPLDTPVLVIFLLLLSSSPLTLPPSPPLHFLVLPVHSLRRCLRWSGRATSAQVLLI